MAPIKTNNPYASYFDFFSRTGKDAVTPEPPPASGLTATGGFISDYESGGNRYRAHIFTSSGALNVTTLGNLPANVEYLVVAGGGGGGSHSTAGGGGAGGVRTNLTGNSYSTPVTFAVTAGPTSYTVTIGAGGARGVNATPTNSTGSGIVGGDTYFGPPSTPAGITSKGGGGGGKDQTAGVNGGSGGGGGGSSLSNYAGGATIAVTTPSPWPGPSVQGYAGGANGPQSSPYTSGGGGGAAAVGTGGGPTNSGPGGAGVQVAIAGPAAGTTGVGAIIQDQANINGLLVVEVVLVHMEGIKDLVELVEVVREETTPQLELVEPYLLAVEVVVEQLLVLIPQIQLVVPVVQELL
jgi:hypothetical protein